MKKNKSVYLTKWEKQIITAMIETHLENVKTNPYFKFIKGEFQRMINKLEVKEETIQGVITKPIDESVEMIVSEEDMDIIKKHLLNK
jgi:hypothetical protein